MRILCLVTTISSLILIFLSGCAVRSTQLNTLIEWVSEPSLDLSENRWLLQYSDYESEVYAISTSEGTLFSNNQGDQVLFDGWVIRIVYGLGRKHLDIKVEDLYGARFLKGGSRIPSRHNCGHWKSERRLSMIRFSQNCIGGQAYTNSILILEDGSISLIRQIVDEIYTPITLTKLK